MSELRLFCFVVLRFGGVVWSTLSRSRALYESVCEVIADLHWHFIRPRIYESE